MYSGAPNAAQGGVEGVSPGFSPGFRLDFIDWSHSLVMTIFWALLFALAFARRGVVVALWCGLSVFSHFILDWLMHPGDLVLWPHASAHFGLGLWVIQPPLWWFFELAFIVVCGVYYLRRARELKTFGGRGWAVLAVVIALHVSNSPWLSPTK